MGWGSGVGQALSRMVVRAEVISFEVVQKRAVKSKQEGTTTDVCKGSLCCRWRVKH